MVDPVELRLTAWELEGAAYVEVADLGPGDTWTAEQPFPVTISLASLAD